MRQISCRKHTAILIAIIYLTNLVSWAHAYNAVELSDAELDALYVRGFEFNLNAAYAFRSAVLSQNNIAAIASQGTNQSVINAVNQGLILNHGNAAITSQANVSVIYAKIGDIINSTINNSNTADITNICATEEGGASLTALSAGNTPAGESTASQQTPAITAMTLHEITAQASAALAQTNIAAFIAPQGNIKNTGINNFNSAKVANEGNAGMASQINIAILFAGGLIADSIVNNTNIADVINTVTTPNGGIEITPLSFTKEGPDLSVASINDSKTANEIMDLVSDMSKVPQLLTDILDTTLTTGIGGVGGETSSSINEIASVEPAVAAQIVETPVSAMDYNLPINDTITLAAKSSDLNPDVSENINEISTVITYTAVDLTANTGAGDVTEASVILADAFNPDVSASTADVAVPVECEVEPTTLSVIRVAEAAPVDNGAGGKIAEGITSSVFELTADTQAATTEMVSVPAETAIDISVDTDIGNDINIAAFKVTADHITDAVAPNEITIAITEQIKDIDVDTDLPPIAEDAITKIIDIPVIDTDKMNNTLTDAVELAQSEIFYDGNNEPSANIDVVSTEVIPAAETNASDDINNALVAVIDVPEIHVEETAGAPLTTVNDVQLTEPVKANDYIPPAVLAFADTPNANQNIKTQETSNTLKQIIGQYKDNQILVENNALTHQINITLLMSLQNASTNNFIKEFKLAQIINIF